MIMERALDLEGKATTIKTFLKKNNSTKIVFKPFYGQILATCIKY